MNIAPFIAAFRAHQWLILAALVIGAFVALSKQGWVSAWLAAKLPSRVVPYYSMAITALAVGSADILSGKTTTQIGLDIFAAWFAQKAGHEIIIEGLRGGRELISRKPTKPTSPPANDNLKKVGPIAAAAAAIMLAACNPAQLAAFDAAIAQGQAAVVPAENVACEAAADLDPTGSTAICAYIDAAGNAVSAGFVVAEDAAAIAALLAHTASKTPTATATLAQRHAAERVRRGSK